MQTAHALLCIFSPLAGLARFDVITWRQAIPINQNEPARLAHFNVISTDILCGIDHGSELACLPSQHVYRANSPHQIRPLNEQSPRDMKQRIIVLLYSNTMKTLLILLAEIQ